MKANELAYALFFGLLLVLVYVFVIEDGAMATGPVTRENRATGPFSELEVDGVLDVYISQGNQESVSVEAKQSVLERVSTEQSGDRLRVKLKKGLRLNNTNIKLFVTVKNLNQLRTSGVVNLRSRDTLRLASLELTSHSVGNTNLQVQCDRLVVDVTSVGEITLAGTARQADIHNTGVGNVKALDLEADVLRVKNTGVGNVEVNARREISITSTGVGNVYYRGVAQVKELSKSGVGQVKKL